MSTAQAVNADEQQRHVMKYVVEKLEKYAHKSHFWRLIHASDLRDTLLRRSRRLSKVYSISDDLVRQYINQLFTDVDQYVGQLHGLLYSSHVDNMIPIINHANRTNTEWYEMQAKRARQLFADKEPLNGSDLMGMYYNYVKEQLSPKSKQTEDRRQAPFDLNTVHCEAERQARDYLKETMRRVRARKSPPLETIDEIIKLGMASMTKVPSNEDFQKSNCFLGRVLIFHRIKEAYKSVLQNTSDDFMLLRFGKTFDRDGLQSTQQMTKQFFYLLHSFLKSIGLLFTFLSATKNTITSSISEISSLFFVDHDSSLVKLSGDLFSPQDNVDRWTWLLEQWRDVLRTMPLLFTEAGAFSRLVRTTIGIGLMHLGKCAEVMTNTGQPPASVESMDQEIFLALQKGFYFGVAYAVVDCLQDEMHNLENIPLHHFLTFDNEKNPSATPSATIDKWLHVTEQLLSGADIDRSQLPKTPFTSMLLDAFDNLLILTASTDNTRESFDELALLLRSQRMDKKDIDQCYDDEQLYLGSVLKAHYTYTCASHLGNMSSARANNDRLWVIPFLGQLTDDCRDFNDDLKSKSVTPFTYYASLVKRQDPTVHRLLNPLEMFLHVCSDIYLSSNRDRQTGAFLGRRIARTLHAVHLTGDQTSFRDFLNTFCANNAALHRYCSQTLRQQFPAVSDPEKAFFRALDASSVKYARTNRKLETYVIENLMKIEDSLNILPVNLPEMNVPEEDLLISAMNYSVKGGGKRLRPLLMLMVADLYGIEAHRILPLTCGIEYLHTSSLIFDDLPAQDNSDLRRGRATLHKTAINGDVPETLCEGRAQLAAVDLIAVSMSLINHGLIKNGFSPERVNRVVSEISLLMHDLCIGQMMDLRAAREGIGQENRHLDKLDRIAWFKTGKTIEVVMITPVILGTAPAKQQELDLARLRELSRLVGIMFQMRDDLLDVEGDENIGKPKALDLKNNTVTYLSVLGVEGTRRRLQQFLAQSLQLADQCWPAGSETVKDVIRYIVTRKH